jgi:hypothetical protein
LAETEEYARRYFDEQRDSNSEYWRRFGLGPRPVGAQNVSSRSGVAVELRSLKREPLRSALIWTNSLSSSPAASAHSDFPLGRPRRIPSRRCDDPSAGPIFDVIVSKDTFEQVEDLTSLLKGLCRRLAPGGQMYTGFSTLYYALSATMVAPGSGAVGACNLAHACCVCGRRPIQRPSRALFGVDIGLNGIRPDQFRAAFDNSGLRLRDIAYNRSTSTCWPCSKRLAGTSGVFDRFATVSIYAVLEA